MKRSQQIIAAVENYYGLEPGDLKGPSRERRIAWPRQLAMYALRMDEGNSFPRIARDLNRLDHTTIMHGCKAFSERARENPMHISHLAEVLGDVGRAA